MERDWKTSDCHMPGAKFLWSHLIITTALQIRDHYLHFIDEGSKIQRD